MKKQNKYAFTLVEMMIVITLLFMLIMFAYLPYAHYQEKLKIRQAIREASQTILGSRNLAINGYDEKNSSGDFANRGLGVYFSKGDNEISKIYSYDKDHRFAGGDSVAEIASDGELYQERKLPTGTLFEGVRKKDSGATLSFSEKLSDPEGILFYYYPITGEHPITGKPEYYYIESGNLVPITDNKIFLEFSYKGSSSPILRKILQYDTRAHIIDYGKGVTEL